MISHEKLHAIGVLCALAAVFIVIVLVSSGSAPFSRLLPASAQDAPKVWVMELP